MATAAERSRRAEVRTRSAASFSECLGAVARKPTAPSHRSFRSYQATARCSAQPASDLSKLCGRTLASERRTRHQMLAHGEPTNDDRLESNGANEALGDGDRF